MGSPDHVITIGTFDGVHTGHRALIRRARAIAGDRGRVTALVFDPNPIAALRPGHEPARLTTFEQRRTALIDAGADAVVRLEPTRELLGLSPDAFLDHLVDEHAPSAIVEGPDFRFGRARAGDVETLDALARERGIQTEIVEPQEVTLTDHSIVPARSTIVRWLLGHGRVGDASILLDRPYTLEGTVIRGARRGRTIGFPTANIETPCMLPASGVYSAIATLPDGTTTTAAISVGTPPTFPDAPGLVEAHLLDTTTETRPSDDGSADCIAGLEEYGWHLRLDLIAWLREQVRYDSLDALTDALARDCARACQTTRPHHAVALTPGGPLHDTQRQGSAR